MEENAALRLHLIRGGKRLTFSSRRRLLVLRLPLRGEAVNVVD